MAKRLKIGTVTIHGVVKRTTPLWAQAFRLQPSQRFRIMLFFTYDYPDLIDYIPVLRNHPDYNWYVTQKGYRVGTKLQTYWKYMYYIEGDIEDIKESLKHIGDRINNVEFALREDAERKLMSLLLEVAL